MLLSQAANLQGVKMLCTHAEGASLRGCNFEDPAGVKANLEGEEYKFPLFFLRPCMKLSPRSLGHVFGRRGQPQGRGHGGKPDDGDQPEGGHAKKRQTEELQPERSHAGRHGPGGESPSLNQRHFLQIFLHHILFCLRFLLPRPHPPRTATCPVVTFRRPT